MFLPHGGGEGKDNMVMTVISQVNAMTSPDVLVEHGVTYLVCINLSVLIIL